MFAFVYRNEGGISLKAFRDETACKAEALAILEQSKGELRKNRRREVDAAIAAGDLVEAVAAYEDGQYERGNVEDIHWSEVALP